MDDFEDAVELLEQNGAGTATKLELIEKALGLSGCRGAKSVGQRAARWPAFHAGAGRETAQAMLGLLEQG
jgi:hypothetical protein